MKQIVLLAIALLALITTACAAPEPTSTPTPAPRATWTPTSISPLASPAIASATLVPVSPSPSTQPSVASATPTRATTPSPTLAPGLYVTNLRIDPNPPTRGSDLFFYPTFVNTTGVTQNYRWQVYIYKPDNLAKSFSDTAAGLFAIPTGTSELKSAGSWKIALGGPCEDFIARPVWLDPNNKAINLTTPDGKLFEKTFRVCAPSDLPSPTPGPSPTPTATPTFAPGVFVMDLRTDPNPPTRGAELNFYVTFANTIGSPQNFKWNVYIYKPGEPNSYGETTITNTTVSIGINEYKSLGSWKLPLGGPCEDFVVRVSWFDHENKLKPFVRFENQVFEQPIRVCPP